jgi:hypothetical protein
MLFELQVTPELVEMTIALFAALLTATNLVPSADEAIAAKSELGMLFDDHELPELVDT